MGKASKNSLAIMMVGWLGKAFISVFHCAGKPFRVLFCMLLREGEISIKINSNETYRGSRFYCFFP